MRTKKTDRCKPRGVSLPLTLDQMVEKRLEELKPRVKGFSHYVQLLVDSDLKGKAFPFNDAEDQTPGILKAA